jgi:hypothetical protein
VASYVCASDRALAVVTEDDPWVKFAKWTLGEITDHEYADYLEARDDGEIDPIEQIIIDRLRTLPMNSRYTDVRPPGWTPADERLLERDELPPT